MSSLAGNEALSEATDEAAAEEMLKWSEELAAHFVQQTGEMEDEAADEFLAPYLRALRTLMRAVNGWTTDSDPGVRLQWWARIEQAGKIIYGEPYALPVMEEAIARLPLAAGAPETLLFLRRAIENQAAKG
jgi:hypothetical protein